MFWFLFIFIYFLISSAAGTLSLSFSFPNNANDDNSNPTPAPVVGMITTLSWARESQDPLSFLITTAPNMVLQNGPVTVDSGGLSSGQVDLVFQQAGSFSIQAIDVNDPTNLLQETPTFTVQSAPPDQGTTSSSTSPTTTSTSTNTTTTASSLSASPSTTSSSSSSSAAASAKSRTVILATVLSIFFVILIVFIIVVVMVIRRRRALKRHTFTPEMMMRGGAGGGGGGAPVLGISFPSETDLERGSGTFHTSFRGSVSPLGLAINDEIDIFSPSKDAVAFSSKPVLSPPHLSANANWLSRPPTRSELTSKRTSGGGLGIGIGDGRIRALPPPPVVPVSAFVGGRSPRELPRPGQVQTARDFYYREEFGVDSPVSAKTYGSTAELRGKMADGLEKVRKARRSQYYG